MVSYSAVGRAIGPAYVVEAITEWSRIQVGPIPESRQHVQMSAEPGANIGPVGIAEVLKVVHPTDRGDIQPNRHVMREDNLVLGQRLRCMRFQRLRATTATDH